MNMTDGYRPLQKASEVYFAGGNYSIQLFIYKIQGGAYKNTQEIKSKPWDIRVMLSPYLKLAKDTVPFTLMEILLPTLA